VFQEEPSPYLPLARVLLWWILNNLIFSGRAEARRMVLAEISAKLFFLSVCDITFNHWFNTDGMRAWFDQP